MLVVKNLKVNAGDKEILRGINLRVNAGEVHAIMGPNGSGKSTLAQVIAGKESFLVTEGDILFEGESILKLAPDKRARLGIFLGFQYPVEIPGVGLSQFLRVSMNAVRKARGEKELDIREFLRLAKEKLKLLKFDDAILSRNLNEGFSGGEKKRTEILQMALLEPRLALLDETDSGLDIDALKIVAEGINGMRSKDRAIVLVTHYQRLLNYIVPDAVHVLANGRIAESGSKELAQRLEREGYAAFGAEEQAAKPLVRR